MRLPRTHFAIPYSLSMRCCMRYAATCEICFDFTQGFSPRIHIGRRVLPTYVPLTFTTAIPILLIPSESTYRSQTAYIREKQLHPLQDLRRTQFEDHWKPSHISFPSWRPRTFRHPQPSRHRQYLTIWPHQMLSSTTKASNGGMAKHRTTARLAKSGKRVREALCSSNTTCQSVRPRLPSSRLHTVVLHSSHVVP